MNAMACYHCGIEVPEPWRRPATAFLGPGLGRRDFCGLRCLVAHVLGMLTDEAIRAAYWKAMGRKESLLDGSVLDGSIDADLRIVNALRFYADPQNWEWNVNGDTTFQTIDTDQGELARTLLRDLSIPLDE